MSSGTPRHTSSTSSSRSHRRDNSTSMASVSSRGSERGSERGSRSSSSPAVESAVTRLLVSIKSLLEALTLWANLKMSEEQVSDVYVRLGNDFNAAVAAFGSFNIDMAELMNVPDELRNILESCLAEDATVANLEIYLPDVRGIITNLLQGLRTKQSIYRKTVADARQRSEAQGGAERMSSRSSHSSRSERTVRQDSSTTRMRTMPETEGTPTPSEPRRRGTSSSQELQPRQDSVGGSMERSSTPRARSARESPTASNHVRSQNMSSTVDADEREPARTSTPGPSSSPALAPEPIPSSPAMQAPPEMRRYSLVDKPVPMTPVVVVNEVPSLPVDNPQTPTINGRPGSPTIAPAESAPSMENLSTPAVASSLAALKNSDHLERRASKRFSTYNISKMTGVRDRTPASSNPNRRSMVAGGSAPTAVELDVVTEGNEEEDEGEEAISIAPTTYSSPRKPGRMNSASRSGRSRPAEPPVPPIPTAEAPGTATAVVLPPSTDAQSRMSPSPPTGPMTVFLQVGREVKKVIVEPNPSFAALRVLFVDKFAYNPGKDNFPHIYIRDPSSSVMYELEDTSEIQRGSLLTLNIEPLDQIKQHIDMQMSTLTQEIKDLRMVVSSNRRASHTPAPTIPIIRTEPETVTARPTDRQFQQVARRLSRIVNGVSYEPMSPQMTGGSLQPQFTGGSVMSEASSRIITDLKTQFDEVQNLRRDLGVMRQLYTEFIASTKDSLGQLRTQTQNVRELANVKVGGARAYIDSGKATLDTRSQDVLTRVEELQDTVETLKDDVIRRQMTPRPQIIRKLKDDMDAVSVELRSLKEQITTVKPMWKKTWEEELQNIVEEQGFLSHQEEFLADLQEDYKALEEVHGHIDKIISIRGAGGGSHKGRGFRPPPLEAGHTGLSTVMMEIRGAQVDPERRLKAIEASQKSRQRELQQRPDEFEQELSGFVQGKKLKMTGGAEEVERVRQRKAEASLKAMFTPSMGEAALPPEEFGEGMGNGGGDFMSGIQFDTM